MESAKLIVEVVAGMIPEQPMPEYTRRWVITSKEGDEAEMKDEHSSGMPVSARALLIIERTGQAQAYATALMNPSLVNWVRIDWIWL